MRARVLTVPLAMWLSTAPATAAQQATPSPVASVAPLPTIGLPLPHIGLPRLNESTAPDDTRTPPRRPDPGRRGSKRQGAPEAREPRRQQPSVVFFPVLPVAPGVSATDATQSEPSVQRAPGASAGDAAAGTGTLAFDLQPSMAADVFVDGSYAGTTEVVGEGLELTPGRHTVELRASGYDVRRFDTQIGAGKTVTFRGSLTKSEEPPQPGAADAASTPKTFYVVPGCYAGDVPPQQTTLPAGCDATLVKTFTR